MWSPEPLELLDGGNISKYTYRDLDVRVSVETDSF